MFCHNAMLCLILLLVLLFDNHLHADSAPLSEGLVSVIIHSAVAHYASWALICRA